VSPRARVTAIVAVTACLAAGTAVGVTLLQTRGEQRGTVGVTKPRKGSPPLLLDFGLRTDGQATVLRRAVQLYDAGRHPQAEAIFSRYRSVEARIGAAFSTWPKNSLDRVKEVVAAAPANSTAQLHLGLAYYWSGRTGDAVAAWRTAETAQPDSPAAVHASDLLHPALPVPGLPPFTPSFGPPAAFAKLSAPQELAALARAARRPDAHAKILYGVALQRLGHRVSAEREFAAAARLAPQDPEAQVAAAVGRFTKEHPEAAFSRLGPLVKTFPRAATVRFHLGLLLLWLGEVPKARSELRQAAAEAPDSALGTEARSFLARLARIGTK
jgi:tetratricopeptide (TPR) repeat protein